MMYNSQIQRLHSFHRLPAQAVEACARLSESGASQCPCLPEAAEGTSHDVMSAYDPSRTSAAPGGNVANGAFEPYQSTLFSC